MREQNREYLKKPDGTTIPIIWNVHPDAQMILLCLHGYAGDKNSSVIAALMERLEEKRIGVVTFDWPAHGESDAPDSALTVENCLADLDIIVKLIENRTELPISCFATSFGGYLATLYRNENPDVFELVILRSPALKMSAIFCKLLPENDFEKLMNGEEITQGFDRKMKVGKRFYDSLCQHEAFSADPPHSEKMFIIQGDKDTVVAPEDTVSYARRNDIRISI